MPVDVLSTLDDGGGFLILGTNLLERFLATMDYPRRRLILSRRQDARGRAAHLAELPDADVGVPFYLWSSHLMFARGGLGDRRDLNLFVDSGLLSLHPDGKGGTRQASFTTSKRTLRAWGVPPAAIAAGVYTSSEPLRLGPLVEDDPLIVVGAAGDQRFGGVRIHGLISHAFLKRYVWMIDFDTRQYHFATRPEPGSAR